MKSKINYTITKFRIIKLSNCRIAILANWLIIVLANCLIVKLAHCQTLSPYVFPTTGGYVTSPNMSISFTIGETFTPTLQNSNMMLTQGFQQPELQLITGNITGTYCAGSNISIPFTASGIINTNNIFTAQLSNAVGSFASPVNIGTLIGNTSGSINATIPIGTAVGSGYRIRVISSSPNFVAPNNGTNIQIITGCFVSLNLKLFLEGYYAGLGTMQPVLLNQGIGVVLDKVDAINVELHSSTFPYGLVASSVVLLNTDGTTSCNFSAAPGSYYIVIKHRNTVETWSANPVALSAAAILYNFSLSNSQAYGNNMTQVEPNVWAFYTGDVNQDENVDLLDLTDVETDINGFLFGYYETDLNGDGNVDLLDVPILEDNINSFIFSNHP